MNNSIYVIDAKIFASDGDRFIGCIFDLLFVFVTFFVSGITVVIIGNIFNWDLFSIWEELVNRSVYGTLFTYLMLNYFFLEWSAGRTLGKLVTGTVVVNKNGLKPGFVAVLIRTLSRLIPFDALSFLGKSGRIWHDSISGTYVVNRKALKISKETFDGIEQIGIKDENL